MNALQRIVQKAIGLGDPKTAIQRALYQWLGNGQTFFDDQNRENFIRKGYQYNPMLYSVVSYIAKKGSVIPFYIKEIKPNGEVSKIYDHEVLTLLNNPNKSQGYFEFMELAYTFRLVTGNTYLYTVMEDDLRIRDYSELWALPSQYVEIVSGGYQMPVKGYVLDYGDNSIEFPAEKVLHSKMVNLDYQNGTEMYGMSPVKALVRSLDKSNKAYLQQAKQYENGGPSGVLYNESDYNTWTEAQLDEFYRKFNRRFAGPKNGNKVHLSNGKVGFINTGLTPVDLGILEDAKATLKDFCRAYNLAPQLFGDDSASTYNNMMEARKAAYTDAIIPMVDTMAAEFTRFFMKRYNTGSTRYEICADYSDVEELQKDKVEQAQWLSTAYWISTQRKQEIMGEEVDESLPKYMIPMGLITVDDLTYNPDQMQTEPQKVNDWASRGMDYFKGLDMKASYSDYPKSAKNAARRALDFRDSNDIDCGTETGWTRANQIAGGEALSLETVKRTFSFLSRAKTYDTGKFTDSDGKPVCGSIMYAAWGGDSMKNWAERTINAAEDGE